MVLERDSTAESWSALAGAVTLLAAWKLELQLQLAWKRRSEFEFEFEPELLACLYFDLDNHLI